MTNFNLPGYYREQDAKNIKAKLDGKTYMEFQVLYSNYAGNCTVWVSTEKDYEQQELAEMVVFYLASNI